MPEKVVYFYPVADRIKGYNREFICFIVLIDFAK